MRGFASSILGVVALLLLFYTYLSWNAVKDLDKSVTEYVLATEDVKERSVLEISLWKTLKRELILCNALVSGGEETIVGCNEHLNETVLAFSSSNGLSTCPEDVVVYTPPLLRFVCPVRGKVGRAEFLIPVGAEVRP